MKLQIEKKNLIDAVNIVSKAIPGKTTMTILECILIDASTEKIRLIANDMELGIQTTVEGEITEHGIIAIDADIFANIVRKLPDGIVYLNTDGEQVTIVCDQARFSIMGRDGSEFVYLPEIPMQNGVQISEFTLKNIIDRTIFAISTNDSNRLMTGELFEIQGDRLRVVALDGHRISIRREELNDTYDNRKVIIPGKTLSEVSKILPNDTQQLVTMYFTDKHVLFQFQDTIVVSRLIEGEYFRIDQMIYNDFNSHINISRQELLSCLDRATLLVKEEDKKPIILNITDENVELKINTSIGSMDEVIPISKDGQDLKIGFNPRFLIDAFRSIDQDMVDIYFLSPTAPVYVRDGSDFTYCYIILPVNFIDA